MTDLADRLAAALVKRGLLHAEDFAGDDQPAPVPFGMYDLDSDPNSKTFGTVRLPYYDNLPQPDKDLIARANARTDAASVGVANVVYGIGDRFVVREAIDAFGLDPKSAIGALILQNTEWAGSETMNPARSADQSTVPPLRYEKQPHVTAIGRGENPEAVIDHLLVVMRQSEAENSDLPWTPGG